jgi:biotin carboxyl carrier protein
MRYVAITNGDEVYIETTESGEVVLEEDGRTAHLEPVDNDSLFTLLIGTVPYEVFVERSRDRYFVTVRGSRYEIQVEEELFWKSGRRDELPTDDFGEATLTSPMPGIVVAIPVAEGQAVERGQVVAILEAMKMENELRAPHDGVVRRISAAAGQTVNLGDPILCLAPPEQDCADLD